MIYFQDGKEVDVNIVSEHLLPTPREVKAKVPRPAFAQECVATARNAVEGILTRSDPRLMLIVGPCSLHDTAAGLEYAKRLAELKEKVEDTFLIIMRVYLVKPRTTIGWKGFINDPYLDDSFRIEDGLFNARSFLVEVNNLGLPAGTEALDAIIPQYIDDLIAWTAIGARTAESQMHRELASGLSTPVGFKNATDGSIGVAVNALKSMSQAHRFLGVDQDGKCAVFHTKGNKFGHIVLRGGSRPNYDSVSIALCEEALKKASLDRNIVIDCSHGNSNKDYALQPLIMRDCVQQIIGGNTSIVGLMLESFLKAGRQDITSNPKELVYGLSVTDACIDWNTTQELVLDAYEKLKPALDKRGSA